MQTLSTVHISKTTYLVISETIEDGMRVLEIRFKNTVKTLIETMNGWVLWSGIGKGLPKQVVPVFPKSEVKVLEESEEDEIRHLLGFVKEEIDSYEPSKAAEKVGNRWMLELIGGAAHPGLFDTKREAILTATAHRNARREIYDNPKAFHTVTALRARRQLELATEIKAKAPYGTLASQIWEQVRKQIPDRKAV